MSFGTQRTSPTGRLSLLLSSVRHGGDLVPGSHLFPSPLHRTLEDRPVNLGLPVCRPSVLLSLSVVSSLVSTPVGVRYCRPSGSW